MIDSQPIRTLFITRHPIYPLTGGAILRNWQNINLMVRFGSVAVFSIGDSFQEFEPEIELPLEIDLWTHHPILFNTQRSIVKRLQSWLLPYRHRISDSLYNEDICGKLERLITDFKPDLVVFEELWLYRYLPLVERHNCQVILDNHNVEAPLFFEKRRPFPNFFERLKTTIAANKIKAIESDFISRSNQVWVCSKVDADLIHQAYGTVSNTHIIPNGLNAEYYKIIESGECIVPGNLPKSPRTLVFAANYSYPPNQVAAKFLLDEIFPKLQSRYPDCCLILAGREPTQKMLDATKQSPSIFVTGTVPDIRPYLFASSIVIVPLLQGGGTRLKILEAFAANRPVVSTAKGAEGIKAQNRKHLLIQNTADELVDGVSQLWSEPDLYQSLVQNARELFESEYSWNAVGKEIEKKIKLLVLEDKKTSLKKGK